LTVIAGDRSNTIVFPMDMLGSLTQAMGRGAANTPKSG